MQGIGGLGVGFRAVGLRWGVLGSGNILIETYR